MEAQEAKRLRIQEPAPNSGNTGLGVARATQNQMNLVNHLLSSGENNVENPRGDTSGGYGFYVSADESDQYMSPEDMLSAMTGQGSDASANN